jgi:hypothetical protein
MEPWPDIPRDVIEWISSVFGTANRRVTEVLLNVPNIRETSLDDQLIQTLIPSSSPRILNSGSIVRLDIHNIGGLRRLSKWETADIAVLVFVQKGNKIVAQKIGLLQSKRLYPANKDVDDEDPVGFRYGMNAFFAPQPQASKALQRRYEFDGSCLYGALKAGDSQVDAIDHFNREFGVSLFYLFYNPPTLPSTTGYPVLEFKAIESPSVGARVSRATTVHKLLKQLDDGRSPSFDQVQKATMSNSNWRLEKWAAELLLTCKVGQPIGENREELVNRLVMRRSGPIGAAIAVNITLRD